MSKVKGKSAYEWIQKNHPYEGTFRVYYKGEPNDTPFGNLYGNGDEVTFDKSESTGQLRWMWTYKNGKQIGKTFGWWPDGTIRQEKHYNVDGEKHGYQIRYYPNGRIMDKLHWKNGKRHGTQTSYNKYGICVNGEAEFIDGEFIKYSVPPLVGDEYRDERKKHPKVHNAKLSFILVWSDTNTMNRNDGEIYQVNDKVNSALLQHTHLLISQILKMNPHEILIMDNEGNFPKYEDSRVRVIPSYQSVGYLDGERPEWLDKINISDYTEDKHFDANKSTAMAYNHGITEATGDYLILQHNDTMYLKDFDIADMIIELEKNNYAYITIDKKPPKNTSPKGYDYFADCYWFLCRKDFYSNNDIWVDWSRGDNNHLATIKCKETNQKYLHLPGFFETGEHTRYEFNKLYGFTHENGNLHIFKDRPILLHLKGGTGLFRILREKR